MRLLMTSACFINHGDDGGARDYAVGDFADVPKDTARFLVENQRGLYTNRKEDHDKDGRNTATEAEVKAAEREAAERAKAAKAQA